MNKKFVFRKYKVKQGKKKKEHPKLIIGEIKDNYLYMGLTSSKSKGKRHKNFELLDNPEIDKNGNRKPDKSYLRRKIEIDKKSMFRNVLNNYQLSERDEIRLLEKIEHKKR